MFIYFYLNNQLCTYLIFMEIRSEKDKTGGNKLYLICPVEIKQKWTHHLHWPSFLQLICWSGTKLNPPCPTLFWQLLCSGWWPPRGLRPVLQRLHPVVLREPGEIYHQAGDAQLHRLLRRDPESGLRRGQGPTHTVAEHSPLTAVLISNLILDLN